MLEAVRTICAETKLLMQDNGACTIEQVSNLVEAYTQIDEVRFVQYDVPATNPIWGEFLRWNQFVPYGGEKTIVEVRYAAHLSVPERRFVVGKELCHALESDAGRHTASNPAVSGLITELALMSAQAHENPTVPAMAERLAEACAIELFMPLEIRKTAIANGDFAEIGVPGMAQRFRMPEFYVDLAFNADYIQVVESVFED